ncbi:MAG: DUF4935 domain-containing protein, partial [Tritonibacter mobilis]|nr:DUF4935 domain-containing protein [Tritonibacter mobilis]
KIVALIQEEEVTLLANVHLQNEVYKNRDRVLSDVIKSVGAKLQFRVPRICEGLDQAKEIGVKVKEANKLIAELQKEVEGASRSQSLRADKVIKELFQVAKFIDISEETIAKATSRVSMGYPPGKQGSIGDAIHWITLLNSGHPFVHVVTRDGDFRSPLDGTTIASFLSSEWQDKHFNFASVHLHSSLSHFLSEKFPDIKLSEEAIKNSLVDELIASGNFATTHAVVEQLSKFNFFTNKQVSRIFHALVENTQVGWIATDADLQDFFLSLKDKAYWVPKALQSEAAELLEVDPDDFFSLF